MQLPFLLWNGAGFTYTQTQTFRMRVVVIYDRRGASWHCLFFSTRPKCYTANVRAIQHTHSKHLDGYDVPWGGARPCVDAMLCYYSLLQLQVANTHANFHIRSTQITAQAHQVKEKNGEKNITRVFLSLINANHRGMTQIFILYCNDSLEFTH